MFSKAFRYDRKSEYLEVHLIEYFDRLTHESIERVHLVWVKWQNATALAMETFVLTLLEFQWLLRMAEKNQEGRYRMSHYRKLKIGRLSNFGATLTFTLKNPDQEGKKHYREFFLPRRDWKTLRINADWFRYKLTTECMPYVTDEVRVKPEFRLAERFQRDYPEPIIPDDEEDDDDEKSECDDEIQAVFDSRYDANEKEKEWPVIDIADEDNYTITISEELARVISENMSEAARCSSEEPSFADQASTSQQPELATSNSQHETDRFVASKSPVGYMFVAQSTDGYPVAAKETDLWETSAVKSMEYNRQQMRLIDAVRLNAGPCKFPLTSLGYREFHGNVSEWSIRDKIPCLDCKFLDVEAAEILFDSVLEMSESDKPESRERSARMFGPCKLPDLAGFRIFHGTDSNFKPAKSCFWCHSSNMDTGYDVGLVGVPRAERVLDIMDTSDVVRNVAETPLSPTQSLMSEADLVVANEQDYSLTQ